MTDGNTQKTQSSPPLEGLGEAYTDHLGNVRLSYSMDHLTGKLKILEENQYYPFGLRHEVYVSGTKLDFSRNPGDGIEPEPGLPPVLDYVTRMEYQYKYNGKEWQDELNLNTYAYGWRDYDPAIGRFNKIDRFADKYHSVSPYSYTANNPIRFIDVKGDSINVAGILAYDKANKTDLMGTLIKDLNTITGMSFEVTGEMLTYKLNEDGTVMIAKDADGNFMGSDKAQSIMMDAIDNKKTAFVNIGKESYVSDKVNGPPVVGGDQIHLSPDQINQFIKGTHGVDNRTMGYGMVFMHETLHTNVAMGGPRADSLNGTGPVVDIMNTVRTELNAQGMDFGTRARYMAIPISRGSSILSIPFDGSYIGTTPSSPGAVATAGGSVTWISVGP